jgi:hypothetical protein
VKDFQLAALAQIAEEVLAACEGEGGRAAPRSALAVHGGIAWAPLAFAAPVRLYASPHDLRVAPVVAALCAHFEGVLTADAASEADGRWLLFLSEGCFEGEAGTALALEWEAAARAGRPPLMLYSPEECEFGSIIEATPRALRELGVFGALAIEWHGGALQRVSRQLVARAIGASKASGWPLLRGARAGGGGGGGGTVALAVGAWMKSRRAKTVRLLDEREPSGKRLQGAGSRRVTDHECGVSMALSEQHDASRAHEEL